VDSDDEMETIALANTVVPETAMSDMCGEAVGERHAPPDPHSTHPASRSNIPNSSHSQSANLLLDAHNIVSVSSNQQVAGSSTIPTTSVSLSPNQNILVDYLREFKEEKNKAICKMSKTQLKMFGLISNGKCVNGVPYADPTQFLSALCSFWWDLAVIYYPTKCKGIFSFDFGQSVFIEEFGYLGWMEMSVQCKLIGMTDFSPKAKHPTLPKLNSIADLLSHFNDTLTISWHREFRFPKRAGMPIPLAETQ
jgi:hypothetical protein